MNRGDVSFTFQNRVEEVKLNILDQRWQSTLALALTLPDICGGIAFPELVKRYRDGKVVPDRQKNPTRDVGSQYIRWFDEYAAPFFRISPEDDNPYICGERCWQLRCEYLHQNKGFRNDEEEEAVRFHLGVNCGTSLCQMSPEERAASSTDIRIDIEQFCLRMCQAAESYYEGARREQDFGLYNTPVLDFVQFTQRADSSGRVIAIVCRKTAYGQGLAEALKGMSEHIQVFGSIEAAGKKFRAKAPDLWILVPEAGYDGDMAWVKQSETPVLLLSSDFRPPESETVTVMEMPVSLPDFRSAVKACLSGFLNRRGGEKGEQ